MASLAEQLHKLPTGAAPPKGESEKQRRRWASQQEERVERWKARKGKKKGPTPEEAKELKRRRKEKRRADIAARRRCTARRVDGKRCRARATIGELCGIHGKSRVVKDQKDTYEPYEEYLASPHWIDFKRKYYEIYVAECAFCKASGGVDLHHRTYANRGSENFSDVVPLCREHHYECHNYDRQHPELTLEESTVRWLNGAQPMLRSHPDV